MSVKILYFASLADHAQCSEESVDSQTLTATAIYEDARLRHGFRLGIDTLRVAVNGVFVGWESTVNDGDEIVFILPVSGG